MQPREHAQEGPPRAQRSEHAGRTHDAPTTGEHLLTYGTWTFKYTANGELETKKNTATGDEWAFQYDALGNLLSVGLPNGDLVEYLVDGMGRRVGKKKNGVLLKQWIYRDVLKPVAELDGSGNLVALFVYGSSRNVPDYVVRGGATYRVVSDHLGSPRYVVNVANASDVPFRASYASFGESTGTVLDWIPFGFAGGLPDQDTGLVRFGARDYEPMMGRWTARDPSIFKGGYNLYRYANSDPVNFIDPIGRWPFFSEWHFRDAWHQLLNPGPPRWPGLFPGEGPAWHHYRNLNQVGRCPPKQPPSNMCGEGEQWENWGNRNPFHGFNTDLRGQGDLAGVQCIYDSDGDLVTAPAFEGSWDYFPPGDNMPGHVGMDVVPWFIWGP